MRKLALALLALTLGTTGASATEDVPVRTVVPSVVEAPKPATATTSQKLDEIAVEERSSTSDARAAQLGPRGSFWWLVGVVVVAGVILAVLL